MIPLPPQEVHVWTASRDAPDDVVGAMRGLLEDAELRRADRFVNPVDRRRFAVGRGLLRTILGRYLDRDPGAIRFVTNPHGKPELDPDLNPQLPIRFNLAHSGSLVLYALSLGRDLGVDIEQVRPDFGGEALAGRFFAPGEVAALSALPESDRTLAFFHGWTRKEAYIKAKGKGLAIPLDEFEVTLGPDRPAMLLSTLPDPDEAARWSLVELPAEPGYVAAACVKGHGWTLRRAWWDGALADR
ncbi:4'-phosphopantetheinyl transferase family protein [Tundrisphaera lichenicola]|uniref:4'-phosphopantetheinyl transferase family protein n=1 Tax=Tundrisphaera lichenicola TaxID=2029860 RepID=UPI003EBCEC45